MARGTQPRQTAQLRVESVSRLAWNTQFHMSTAPAGAKRPPPGPNAVRRAPFKPRFARCLSVRSLPRIKSLAFSERQGLDAAFARFAVAPCSHRRRALLAPSGSSVPWRSQKARNKPTFDDRPGMLERVGAVLHHLVSAPCADASDGPRRPSRRWQDFRDTSIHHLARRRYGGVARPARDHLAEPLLSRRMSRSSSNRIEAIELLSQS